jgi:hypothetical protein
MTIAIAVKVHNGVVFAADSAATLTEMTRDGQRQVVNVFNSARKIFKLHDDIKVPIGLIVWGEGGIGRASISTLAKDLRQKFMGIDKTNPNYEINPENFTLENVAKLTRQFFFEETYINEFRDNPNKPFLGMMVGGYSSGEGLPELWEIDIQADGNCPEPVLRREKEDIGLFWAGQPEVITRIVRGHGMDLGSALVELGLPPDQVNQAVEFIGSKLNAPLVYPPMPIQETIDLAVFLVETAINFSRFLPGWPLVGGPVDVAAITKHEGFRWVQRKFWFRSELNPIKRKEKYNDFQ